MERLKKATHEKFSQLYAGKAFGNATKAYLQIAPKVTEEAAAVEGCRLLRIPKVFERIQYLRNENMRLLAIDRVRILELRLKIAYDKDEFSAVKLAALRDIEKSLGLAMPERHELEIRGSVLVIE